MSRVAELPVDQWPPELKGMVQGESPSPLEKVTRGIMAHAPHMASANAAFVGIAMKGRKLSRRLLELMRLRVAFHNQCRICMTFRFLAAIDDGLTDEMVTALENPKKATSLSDQDKAALEYVDLFVTNHSAITDGTFNELRRHFSEAEIVELSIFTGYFLGFGRYLANLEITEGLPAAYQDKSKKVGPWLTTEKVVINDRDARRG